MTQTFLFLPPTQPAAGTPAPPATAASRTTTAFPCPWPSPPRAAPRTTCSRTTSPCASTPTGTPHRPAGRAAATSSNSPCATTRSRLAAFLSMPGCSRPRSMWMRKTGMSSSPSTTPSSHRLPARSRPETRRRPASSSSTATASSLLWDVPARPTGACARPRPVRAHPAAPSRSAPPGCPPWRRPRPRPPPCRGPSSICGPWPPRLSRLTPPRSGTRWNPSWRPIRPGWGSRRPPSQPCRSTCGTPAPRPSLRPSKFATSSRRASTTSCQFPRPAAASPS